MTLTFNDTKFKVEFNRIISSVRNPRRVLDGAGREVVKQLKSHFNRKDRSEPNKLSNRRSRFWQQVARSVNQPVLENASTVSVTISDPRFAQKLFGGTLRAKRSKFLAIPVEERAYGRYPGNKHGFGSSFENETGLKLVFIRNGKSAFQNAVLAVKEGKGLTVEYVLTKSVNQKADTTALPEKAALETAILARAQRILDNQTSKG